jgi:serine protease Do
MGHLVHEGKAKLWAKTLDGHRYPLNVIKSDNEQDLALLKIVSPARQFKSVKIGNSSQLRKGQQVFNIGNPGTWDEHFEHSVTIGVVAGLNRNDGLIEFSMPGRGGQSGSPVFNTAGTVVGVVVKVTLDDSGKALIPVLMATVDTSGKASFKVENKLIDVMTRNETITMAIPINHARNLLQLTGP